METEEKLLCEAWKARNELYYELFGDCFTTSPANYQAPKTSTVLRGRQDNDTGDPGDETQALAILTYEPSEKKRYWTYITSGLSTPWFQDEPQEVSGFGCELLLKTPDKSLWPLRILRSLAFHIVNSVATLSPGSILKLNNPVSYPNASAVNSLFVWYADEAADAWYQLPSGGFGIFATIGITEDECSYALSIDDYGAWCIQEILRRAGIGQVTDSSRSSVMLLDNIDDHLFSIKQYIDNFRRMI